MTAADWFSIELAGIGTLIGVAVGGIISLLVSRHYAKRGSEELLRQAAVLAHAIEGAPIIYDAEGQAIGFRLEIAGTGGGTSSGSATITLPLELTGTAVGNGSASAAATTNTDEDDP
ncbi:MAG: hypothetical protein ACR2PL_05155 [Dehalococcoidia bacterium]